MVRVGTERDGKGGGGAEALGGQRHWGGRGTGGAEALRRNLNRERSIGEEENIVLAIALLSVA